MRDRWTVVDLTLFLCPLNFPVVSPGCVVMDNRSCSLRFTLECLSVVAGQFDLIREALFSFKRTRELGGVFCGFNFKVIPSRSLVNQVYDNEAIYSLPSVLEGELNVFPGFL